MNIRFYRLYVGNDDFVLVDATEGEQSKCTDQPLLGTKILDRRKGVGGNGLIMIEKPQDSLHVRLFSAKGNERDVSPDASLCAARYILDSGKMSGDSVLMKTRSGEIRIDVLDGANLGTEVGIVLDAGGKTLGESAFEPATIGSGESKIAVYPVRLGREIIIAISDEKPPKTLAKLHAYESYADARESKRPKAARTKAMTVAAFPVSRSRIDISTDGDSLRGACAALAVCDRAGFCERESWVDFGIGIAGDPEGKPIPFGVFAEIGSDGIAYGVARAEYACEGDFYFMDPQRDAK